MSNEYYLAGARMVAFAVYNSTISMEGKQVFKNSIKSPSDIIKLSFDKIAKEKRTLKGDAANAALLSSGFAKKKEK